MPGRGPAGREAELPGTVHPTERDDNLNGLLSYTQPLKDRVRVSAGTREVQLSIRYRGDLDPKSFKVQPGWARHFFHPKPGTQETARLPLNANKRRYRFWLEARPAKATGLADTPTDRDVFEFRVGPGP